MKKFLQALAVSACFFIPACGVADQSGIHTVRYVIDGDTLILENEERVRMIGIDAPEIHDDQHRNAAHAARYGLNARLVDEFAFKAKEFSNREILGKKVRLEYDWERRDKFGRTLAYVFRQSDDLFLNAEVVRQGYGFAYVRFPFKYEEKFRSYQDQARRNRAGLWR